MVEFLIKLLLVGRSHLWSWARLEAENLVLPQQVIVLSRKSRSRVWLKKHRPTDLCLDLPTVPLDFECDHRGYAGDRDWLASTRLSRLLVRKSRRRGGRPRINREIRDLIRRMNKENPLWRVPRMTADC